MPVITFSLNKEQAKVLTPYLQEGESLNLCVKRIVLERVSSEQTQEILEDYLIDEAIDEKLESLDIGKIWKAIEDLREKVSKLEHLNQNLDSNINRDSGPDLQGYVMVKYEDNDFCFYWGGSKQGWTEEIGKAKIYPSEGECKRFMTPMQKKNPSLDIRRAKLSELSG